jgi:broad specificity phosphatase PhoE
MSMPKNLFLVRHGESELNQANALSRRGDNAMFTAEFRRTQDRQFRLTAQGRWQAQVAGDWLRQLGMPFHKFFVSDYVRACETAALLRLNGRWKIDYNLREREWGELSVLPDDERRERYGPILLNRDGNGFYWSPLGGESMANGCMRADRVLGTYHRECSESNVVVVNHGEMMWCFRVRLERLTPFQYVELDSSKDPLDRIHNCQIIHYTRQDPFTGQITPYYLWRRSVCPWCLSKSRNDWERIVRTTYSDDDLLALANEHRQFLPQPEKEK